MKLTSMDRMDRIGRNMAGERLVDPIAVTQAIDEST